MQLQSLIDSVIGAIKDTLTETYIASRYQFGDGNVFQNAIIAAVPQQGSLYVQVADEGDDIAPDDRREGGNWSRYVHLGVGIFVSTNMDVVAISQQAAKDSIYVRRQIQKTLHLFDDETNTAEPMKYQGESAPQLIEIDGGQYVYVHQSYRVLMPVVTPEDNLHLIDSQGT